MTVLFVCADPAVQLTVNSTVYEMVDKGDPLYSLASFVTFEAATKFLEAHPGPQLAALLDPETGGRRQGELDTHAFIKRFSGADDGRLSVVLAIRAPGSDFEIEAVRNPRVWTWDTSETTDAEIGPEERLIKILRAASHHEVPRHFCATVRFDDAAVTLTVEENGVPLIRKRPLLTNAGDKATLQSIVGDDLEPPEVFDPKVWTKYKDKGNLVFKALFGEIGQVLISDATSDTVEFRFVIAPTELQSRFGLPLELIARAADGTHDDFLCSLRPMARRVGQVKRRPADAERPPHILFVDAGAAEGDLEISGDTGLEKRVLKSIALKTEAQRVALQALHDKGRCTLELLTLDEFNNRTSPHAQSFREAMQRRLCKAMPGDPNIDILHFAGHGITRVASETRLLLPSPVPLEIDPLEVKELAEWLPGSVRLVFLAACQTASISSAAHLHQAKGCSVVGFRWKVVATRIPDFVRGFYDAYLCEGKSVAAAYRSGCHNARLKEDPAYVSAVALAVD
jgi:hypothetical protein